MERGYQKKKTFTLDVKFFISKRREAFFIRPNKMKKFALIFAVMALAMFAFVFAVSAQEALPAIDEAEAAAYLGTWHMQKMCFGTNCMDLSGMGIDSTLTLNADNTVVSVSEGEEPQTSSWYMKDGVAYNVDKDENGQPKDYAMTINEDGSLVFGQEDISVYYVREFKPVLGTAEIKADATVEDFTGEWFLNTIILDKDIMPASLIGMSGKLVIREDSLDIILEGEEPEEKVPYTLTDGKILVKETTKDEKGNEPEQTIILEYHTDNTVLLTMEGDESKMYMVYVTEENLSKGPSFLEIFETLSEGQAEGQAEAQTEMSDTELEAALAELYAKLEAEGALEESNDFELSALLGELNLEGLLENINLEELKQQFTNESGEFDLSGLLDGVDVQGLAGQLLGGSENGEGVCQYGWKLHFLLSKLFFFL